MSTVPAPCSAMSRACDADGVELERLRTDMAELRLEAHVVDRHRPGAHPVTPVPTNGLGIQLLLLGRRVNVWGWNNWTDRKISR